MNYYSTQRQTPAVDLKEAVLKGLPSDNGLFMPEKIEPLPADFFDTIIDKSFHEIAFALADRLTGQTLPPSKLEHIIEQTLTFEAPLIELEENMNILELFHGPTLAFKDFGARFMAQLMSYFVEGKSKKLQILVATSGDTGGAVAHGFLDVPNIQVTVLYPKGKVSFLQEKQFTTLGKNITALEIDGTFDDCQALVKKAFLDAELTEKLFLTSANSINISRLIPQTFYYVNAYKQLKDKSKDTVFVVPSGNFGNITAGVLAKKMGLPVKFIAATNRNKIVPDYLTTGQYQPLPSVQTISNAMDVGNPSNFARLHEIYDKDVDKMRADIKGFFYDDEQTKSAITEVRKRYNYTIDPHGAVGYLAFKDYIKSCTKPINGIILETAHPAKFLNTVEEVIGEKIKIPTALQQYAEREKLSIPMSIDFEPFKAFLIEQYA